MSAVEGFHFFGEDDSDKTDAEDSEAESSTTKKKRTRRVVHTLLESDKPETKKSEIADTILERLKKQAKEVEPAPEDRAPADGTLGEEEKPLAVRAAAEYEAAQIVEHSPEDLAALDFLEAAVVTGDIEQAADLTNAKLGAGVEDIAAAIKAIEDNQVESADTDQSELDNAALEAEATEISLDHDTDPESTQLESSDLAAAEVLSGPPASARGSGFGGSANPPRTPFGSPIGPGPMSPDGQPALPTLSGNLYHTPLSAESPYVERYDQGNPAVTALIGGLIGYFIGRRRGRIKAEKQAAKVQNKLEKQIEDIHWQLKAKETQIRRVAAEKVQHDGPVLVEALALKKSTKLEDLPRPTFPERRVAAEANQLPSSNVAHEQIGQMLVGAEAVPTTKRHSSLPEASRNAKIAPQKSQEQITQQLRERHVETLSRAELLALSEKVVVDGSSLRQIYETHLIGEHGLRRLVTEYLHGGDLKEALRREVIEREIDFERDPALRDMALPTSPTTQPAAAGASQPALDALLENASANLGDRTERAAFNRARAVYEARSLKPPANRSLLNISLITIIVSLAALVIILYLARH